MNQHREKRVDRVGHAGRAGRGLHGEGVAEVEAMAHDNSVVWEAERTFRAMGIHFDAKVGYVAVVDC